MWHRHTPVPSHGMKRYKYLLCLGISIIFIKFGSSSTTGAPQILSCPQHSLQPRSGSAGAQPSPPVPLPAPAPLLPSHLPGMPGSNLPGCPRPFSPKRMAQLIPKLHHSPCLIVALLQLHIYFFPGMFSFNWYV